MVINMKLCTGILAGVLQAFWKNRKKFVDWRCLGAGFVLLSVSAPILADEEDRVESEVESERNVRTWKIMGTAVTGANDVCGEPQWVMPPPLLPDQHFTLIGKFNEADDAKNSIPLTKEICLDESTVLATHSNSALNALGGFPDADDRMKNRPLRSVPVKALPDGTRMTLPAMADTDGNPFPPTKNQPDNPITVGDWLKAQGKMTIWCYPNGYSKVKAKFRHLVPNSVYSLVATWLTIPPGETLPTFASIAFGGVPNVLSSNSRGNAVFVRELSYCPMDVAPDGSVIMFANLGYHADGMPHGVFQQTITELDRVLSDEGEVFLTAKPPGVITLPHVQFPITITPQPK